eukprot:scaffold8992_cov144-Skeletonema_menzelii.AAC.2
MAVKDAKVDQDAHLASLHASRPPNSLPCSSKRIAHVELFRPKKVLSSSQKQTKKPQRRFFLQNVKSYHLLFFALYIHQLYWIVSTMGTPYTQFLLKAEREGFTVMEGSAKLRAELSHALGDITDENRYDSSKKLGWFDWLHMDIDEHAALKKRQKEQTVLDSLPKSQRVPKRYAPTVDSTGGVGENEEDDGVLDIPEEWMELDEEENPLLKPIPVKGSASTTTAAADGSANSIGNKESTLSTAKTLMGRIEYNNSIISIPNHLPTHVVITPSKAGESKVLLPVLYVPTLGVTFEYHRRRYYLDEDEGEWIKIRCNTTMPLNFFQTWAGISSMHQLEAAGVRFGENKFDVRQPTFKDMQYSAFTLFMILTFEATVVFSRIKSLGALRGMGNTARKIRVFREGVWTKIWTTELLPGDILSLTRSVKKKNSTEAVVDPKTDKSESSEDGDVVPADVLVLRGSTVVNEASLTGESVPQMKEGISELVEGENLDMKTRHKTHVLYAGTKILQCKGVEVVQEEEASSEEDEDGKNVVPTTSNHTYGDIPNPPDGGCICFVLRTGFSSAQGKLVRMIEGSQEKVKGHEKETALLLLLLFFFAVASSSYVLYHGMHDENRSQYELLLHCILIITSVIPPELPMQMALAVNNSLMTLMKLQIFCTEPFRVPIAGKLDACLFDKTGTLTTDELVPVGVMGVQTLGSDLEALLNSTNTKKGSKDDATSQLLIPMTKLSHQAALVLTGCHSLVLIDGETTGDPLESAALKAMRWEVSTESGNVVPSAASEKKQAGSPFSMPGNSSPSAEIEILSRHHFSSKLQRMSCVIRDVANKRCYSVVKGSPEMVGNYLSQKPKGYDKAANFLSRRGYRVISLAYKPLTSSSDIEAAKDTRSACEQNLTFAGFVTFTCRVRRDTKMVLSKLKEGGMSVAMITGDALLTAIHVAKEVNICESGNTDDDAPAEFMGANKDLQALLESKRAQSRTQTTPTRKEGSKGKPIIILEQDKHGGMFWKSYDDDSEVADFVATDVPNLAKTYDLTVTGTNLEAAYEYDVETKKILSHFKVFARMKPDEKETVIECLHSVDKLCLMCGDGANDVGALKQADVGVALLSGFGDVNVDKGEDGNKKNAPSGALANSENDNISVISPRDLQAVRDGPLWLLKMKIKALGVDLTKYPELTTKEDLMKLYLITGKEVAIKVRDKKKMAEKVKNAKEEAKAKQKKMAAEKQEKLALRVKELEEQGVQWAQFKALQEFMSAEKAEAQKRKNELANKHSVAGSASTIAAQLENLEMDEIPMVKVGDASVAAPFTSKMPSIRSCVDIVRQGRCTLVTSIQMYQILALNCLISAYSLSVLYLDGVKYGDTQMTAMGILGSISYMSMSRAKPLDKLSSVKPLTSIFHPSLFISLLGQFAVHLVTMMWAVYSAKEYLEPDWKVDLDGEFKPGILNSVVFLISNVQQVTVFVVNLQGRPFMTGLTENRSLLWSLLASFIMTFMFASESVPSLNKYFQLVPFPNDEFRDFIIKILVADVSICFLFDRLMKLLFCPQILKASVEGTTMKDVMGLARTVLVIGFLANMFLGNNELWDELLEEERRLAEEEALLNATAANETLLTAVKDAVKACVGSHCEDGSHDEF